MNFKDAKTEIKKNWRELYPTSKDGKGIVCPLCGHGKNGDGIIINPKSKDRYGLICFGCGFSGDVISLIEQDEHTDYKTAMESAAYQLGIDLDEPGLKEPTRTERPKEPARAEKTADVTKDLTAYFNRCAADLKGSPGEAYLLQRGISTETAARFNVGYDQNADPAGKGFYHEPRIILPVNKGYYVARRIKDKKDKFDKMNNEGGRPDIFNKNLLFNGTEIVFVAEGYIDALSIIEAGGNAIALNSAANKGKLIDTLKKKKTKATLVLCIDNDDKGKKASAEIEDELKRLKISYITANVAGSHKDANEALMADREALEAEIKKAIFRIKRPDNVGAYIDDFMAGEIDKFKNAQQLKTGFDNLDKKAGGLYPGLYCIAAISSLGKTTIAHQIADNIAKSGNDVLFFSLEQSRLELVTKSISRGTAIEDIGEAVSSLDIRRGKLTDAVLDAAEIYRDEISDKLSIIEGNFGCDISFIGRYVNRYIAQNGGKGICRPVVFIDYLQVLQADAGTSGGKRESIDTAVTELKRLSRDNDITVFIISSINRSNYLTPIDFESLKESGGIEYTCDVIWGLQLQALNEELFTKKDKISEKRERIKEAKRENPRKIELVCLKNRYGVSSFDCNFDYLPEFDYFMPDIEEADAIEELQRQSQRRY